MKTVPLTIRRCPEEVHKALKYRAKVNRRSLNNETLLLLEQHAGEKPMTTKELAARLRKFNEGLSLEDRRQIAHKIEEMRRRMAK
jgi:plasmid stability protein